MLKSYGRLFVIGFVASFTLAACLEAKPNHSEMRAAKAAEFQTRIDTCIETQCTRLDLDGYQGTDFSFLEDLTQLRVLMINSDAFSDLGLLQNPEQFTELHIASTGVSDFEKLPQFKNLTVLHAHALQVADLAPVAKLTKLEELSIAQENLGPLGLKPLAKLRKLKDLKLSSYDSTDLSPLKEHPSLENIDGVKMTRENAVTLLTMPSLKSVYVGRSIPGLGLGVEAWDKMELEFDRNGIAVVYEPAIIVC